MNREIGGENKEGAKGKDEVGRTTCGSSRRGYYKGDDLWYTRGKEDELLSRICLRKGLRVTDRTTRRRHEGSAGSYR